MISDMMAVGLWVVDLLAKCLWFRHGWTITGRSPEMCGQSRVQLGV